MTRDLARYLLALGHRYTALVWITWTPRGVQPLLMPWPGTFRSDRVN